MLQEIKSVALLSERPLYLGTYHVEVNDNVIIVMVICFRNLLIQRQNFRNDGFHYFEGGV